MGMSNVMARRGSALAARFSRRASTKIIWTHTDEAPALASYALLPVIQRFAKPAGIDIVTSDISVAARILSQFPDKLKPDQRVPDSLAELGEVALTPEANMIKLPNGETGHALGDALGLTSGLRGLTLCVARSLGVAAATERGHRRASSQGLRGPPLPRLPVD